MINAGFRKVIRVLVIDDQPADVELLRYGFTSTGYAADLVHVADVDRAKTLIPVLDATTLDLIVLDWNLGGIPADEIAEAYFQRIDLSTRVPLVVMSGVFRASIKAALTIKGAIVREKPFDLEGYRRIGAEFVDLCVAERANAMPILDRLKSETAGIHTELEQGIDLLNRVLTLAAYRALLETFYGLYHPLEAKVYSADGGIELWLPNIEERKRVALLRRDLAALGVTDPEALPLAPVPSFSTVAAKLGCLYVLEGSTLGGQTIARHIREHLELPAENGCAFFTSYGPRIGAMWKQFRESIERFTAAHPGAQDEIVQSASWTFHAFRDWTKDRL